MFIIETKEMIALCFAITREMMPSACPHTQVPYPAPLCPKILAGALQRKFFLRKEVFSMKGTLFSNF